MTIFFTYRIMGTRGRALFNLLRMNAQEDPNFPVEDWQIEDLHVLESDEIFSRLKKLEISLNEHSFVEYAEPHSSPEELVETLWVEEDHKRFDEAYLLLFELWRRYLPEKQSISIFCDHLDYLIDQYDFGEIVVEVEIQNALSQLEQILDENVDHGADPRKVFQEISLYSAHDLESFIYDFISAMIDDQHNLNAAELIDTFSPYIQDTDWFSFLQLRLSEPDEADEHLEELLEKQSEHPDFELLLEIARYLVTRGSISLFLETTKLACELMETEQDFQEILAISSEFCRLLDKEEESEKIRTILSMRQQKDLEQEITQSDPDVKEYTTLFKDLDRSEA